MKICKAYIDYLYENYCPDEDGYYVLTDELCNEIRLRLKEEWENREREDEENFIPIVVENSMDTYENKKDIIKMILALKLYTENILFGTTHILDNIDLNAFVDGPREDMTRE